jgi:hypothetical protein
MPGCTTVTLIPDGGVVGGVRGQGEHPDPGGAAEFLGRRREPVRVPGQQRDVRALGGEGAGDREPDAAAAAGDDGPLGG